jgi:uncharacterized iron-regulated protein
MRLRHGLLALLLCWLLTPAHARPGVLFLGEQHTSQSDHQAQLAALQQLPPETIAVVAEMFTERAAADLEDWNAGKGPADFAPELWKREWGHPFELYAPIFRWSRENSVPVLWLRPDPDYTRQVREKGPSFAVSKIDEVLIGPRSYREFMIDIARRHADGGDLPSVDEAAVDRMFTIQCFWDEFMAWRIAQLAGLYPDRVLVVLVGDGHLREQEGIPWRLRRRAPNLEIEVRRSN